MKDIGKRLHLHISVENIQDGIKFYSTQLQAEPTKVKEDYVQWILDDLSLNFAISTRGYEKGLNHLGIQYESNAALQNAQVLFEKNAIKGKEDKGAVCCYKESNKYWVQDPTGIVWENYYSMKDVEIFGQDNVNTIDGCCMPNTQLRSSSQDNSCCS